MKKIINGKVYDTSTAKELAFYSNMDNWSDFHHYKETLYRKKTGELFLHGEGGGMTRYAESLGNNTWTGGEKVIPLGYTEAKQWAEEHLTAEEYEEIFGAVVEDETKRIVSYSLSVTAVEKLRRAVTESGKTASEIIEELIQKM